MRAMTPGGRDRLARLALAGGLTALAALALGCAAMNTKPQAGEYEQIATQAPGALPDAGRLDWSLDGAVHRTHRAPQHA